MEKNLSKYLNREISWLEFNQRVLDEANEESNPLLERLKFLAITGSNLDEFFMVRVGGLQHLYRTNSTSLDPAGLNATQQLSLISKRTHKLVTDQYACLSRLERLLEQETIVRLTVEQLSEQQKQRAERLFGEDIFSVLAPISVYSADDFPQIAGRVIHVCVRLRVDHDDPRTLDQQDDQGVGERFAVIPLSNVLPRFLTMPSETGYAYLLLEEAISLIVPRFFPNQEILEVVPFRVTRNADMGVREDGAEDLLSGMERILDARKSSNCVRLEIDSHVTEGTRRFLSSAFSVRDEEIFLTPGPLDLSAFMRLTSLHGFEKIKRENWTPQPSPLLDPTEKMFDILQKQSVLLYHPYESYEPILRFIDEAADDPDVLAIKQTLYRTSRESPISKSLMRAAEKGKNVTAIVELKARFDEERNIEWARAMEGAGVHVIYGVKGLKTHAKVCIVVRREPQGIQRYVHFGTGNYNESTAKLYSDASFMTSDDDLGADAISFFNAISGFSQPQKFRKIEIAPIGLREKVLELIDVESQRKKAGHKAAINAKVNALVDPQIIDALYAASQAGVTVNLNIRGICCLRPGVKGLSENIRVVSVVDRFLEHARILHFHHGGDERVFISSADWMGRNLDKRIELLVPIEAPAARDRLIRILECYFKDTAKGRQLMSDGKYRLANSRGAKSLFRSQEVMCKEAIAAALEASQRSATIFEPHRPSE